MPSWNSTKQKEKKKVDLFVHVIKKGKGGANGFEFPGLCSSLQHFPFLGLLLSYSRLYFSHGGAAGSSGSHPSNEHMCPFSFLINDSFKYVTGHSHYLTCLKWTEFLI